MASEGGSDTASPLERLRRLVPRTALGLAALLCCMAVASAFSGAVLYAYYESRQQQTTDKVEKFFGDYLQQIDAAKKLVKAEGDQAKQDIRTQLDELQKFAASGSTLTGLLDKAQPSVWFVQTLDENGAPSVGSAFVVFSDDQQSFLLTSYTVIRAATVQPAPVVTLVKGDERLDATVIQWEPTKDLALLSINKPRVAALPWASTDAQPRIGDRLFAISGLGSAGASITQGFVADVSADGLQHDAPVGTQFQGGPLLNSAGEVVAVASRAYSPLKFATLDVYFAPPIRASCDTVLRCPDGTPQATN
ncbi:MAG: serine protease Do [Acidimicrobiaceae bacterium]